MDIELIDINEQINNMKKTGIEKKLELLHFIRKYKINDYVLDFINEENKKLNDNFTYFVEGGLPWFCSFYKSYEDKFTDELQKISMIPLNYRLHYVYKGYNASQKTAEKNLKMNFLRYLKTQLSDMFKIDTEIIEKQISSDELFKQHAYNLKLIFKGFEKPISLGGVKQTNKLRIGKKEKILKKLGINRNVPQHLAPIIYKEKPKFNPEPISYDYDDNEFLLS